MQGFVPHLYQKLLNNTVKIFSFIEFFMPAIEIFLRRNFLLHFQHFLFQPILALQEGKSNSFWTRLWREGSEGSEGSKGSEGKVLKMDRPAAGGFLSLTALRAEGCGIALSGDEYKISVTGFTFCVIGHEKHSADWLAALATPYPGCAGLPPMQGAE